MGYTDMYVKLLLNVFFRPTATLTQVKASRHELRYGFYTISIFSAIAMINMLNYYFAKLVPQPPMWISYPAGTEWAFSFLLMVPVALLGAILFAGIVQLGSRLFDGKSTFDSQFALYLFAFPPYFILLHIVKFIYFEIYRLSLAGPALLVIMGLVYLMMMLSAKVEQNMKWGPTILLSLIGYVVGALFSMTYIR
jgi:hypothetical protein